MKKWIVTRRDGFDAVVFSKHRTQEAANNYRDSMNARDVATGWTRGRYSAVDAATVRLAEIFGRQLALPK